MKTFKITTKLFYIVFLLFSCSSSISTEPFEANFTGEYVNIITGEDLTDCAKQFNCRVEVSFEGTATQLGKISGMFSFCACGPNGEYDPTDSYLVSEDGDTLFFTCYGRVIEGRLPDQPEYVTSYWRDPFTFQGGTGRFEGAAGGGTTDDYNSSEDPNSHHHWKGNITLKK